MTSSFPKGSHLASLNQKQRQGARKRGIQNKQIMYHELFLPGLDCMPIIYQDGLITKMVS